MPQPSAAPTADAIFGPDGLAGEVRRANAVLGLGPAVRLSRVTARPVTWLWPGRIPRGKLTVLDGDPGLGKSTITLDLAARVSRGLPMPDGAPGCPGGVVLAGAEDDLADTIRPRLDAAGGDCERIAALPVERWNDVTDTVTLHKAIEQVSAVLVVIDPLMAYMPSQANSWRDQDVRRVLSPLAALAAKTGAAIVLVRHLNKMAGGTPLYRGGGFIGIIGAARAGLLVARDPDDGERRVLAVTKSNLAREAPSVGYRTIERGGAVCIEWLGESAHQAAALLGQPASAEERTAVTEASDWLRARLESCAVAARDIRREARDAGIPERTLERAKAALAIRSGKCGFGDGWRWELPPKAANAPKAANISDLADFDETPANTGVRPKAAKPSYISLESTVGGVRARPEPAATAAAEPPQAGKEHNDV